MLKMCILWHSNVLHPPPPIIPLKIKKSIFSTFLVSEYFFPLPRRKIIIRINIDQKSFKFAQQIQFEDKFMLLKIETHRVQIYVEPNFEVRIERG